MRHHVAAGVVHVRVAPAGGLESRQPGVGVSPDIACTIGPHDLNGRYGPVLPEPAVRDVDDVGAQLAQALVAEARALHHAGREVLA